MNNLNASICLVAAIAFEVCGSVLMKYVRHILSWRTVLMLFLYGASLVFCMLAVRRLGISLVYAIWSAAGIAIIAFVGILFLGESCGTVKIISFALVILGIIGLVLGS